MIITIVHCSLGAGNRSFTSLSRDCGAWLVLIHMLERGRGGGGRVESNVHSAGREDGKRERQSKGGEGEDLAEIEREKDSQGWGDIVLGGYEL